jgi:hypothetical protein
VVGLIAYTAVLSPAAESQVFNWLLALSGLSAIFTWLTICLCHIRFKTRWVRVAEIDLVTGRREDADEVAVLKELDRIERTEWPWWRRGYEFLC